MKHYSPGEKIAKEVPSAASLAKIGSRLGSVDELILQFRVFYKGLYSDQFDWIVKYLWMEHQYTYDGVSQGKAQEQGIHLNRMYGYFMKFMVGFSQKPLSDGIFFHALSSYIPDLFPTFYDHNPFEETEYFKLPYKNISIPHMVFVYQCDKRMEMLSHADGVGMSYGDFRDWALNYVESDTPSEYELSFWHNSYYIKKKNKTGRYKNKE